MFFFNSHWIGGTGPVNWLARLPDLTSPDVFLWGYVKDKLYKQELITRENINERIRNACAAFKQTHFSMYIQYVLSWKVIILSTYFNWKMMRWGDLRKSSTLVSERRKDSHRSNSRVGERRGNSIKHPERRRDSPKSSNNLLHESQRDSVNQAPGREQKTT